MVSDKAKKIFNLVGLYLVLVFLAIIVAEGLGLGKGGFDNTAVLAQYEFYAGTGLGLLTALLVLSLALMTRDAGDGTSTYGSSTAFASPNEPPALLGKTMSNPIKLFLISFIIFSIMGIYSSYTNTYFTGVAALKEQFTFFDSLLFSAVLVPASENAGAAFVFALFLFFFRRYAKDHDLGKGNFVTLSILAGVFLFALYGGVFHLLRYGSSDISVLTVVIFWAVGGLLTALTGSFIPFWVMHICNNLFFDLKGHFSNDIILLYAGMSIAILGFLYVILFARRKKKGDDQ